MSMDTSASVFPLGYPSPRRSHTVRDQAGHQVSEPYEWMQDGETSEVQEWVQAQNTLTASVLQTTEADKILPVLKDLFNFPKYGTFSKHGEFYYFWHNTGLQNQDVLYRTPASGGDLLTPDASSGKSELERGAVVVLDPNTLVEDGTAAIRCSAFSHSGKYLAYGVSRSGSDWSTIYVMDAETGENVKTAEGKDVEIQWVKFSGIDWKHDDSGFFFQRYAPPETFKDDVEDSDFKRGTETDKASNQKLCFFSLERMGEPAVIYEEPSEPEWMFGTSVSDDGKLLFITVGDSCAVHNRLWFVELENAVLDGSALLQPAKLVDEFEFEYNYVSNDGMRVWLQSNQNAKRGKIISVQIQPGVDGWTDEKEVVGQDDQGDKAVLERCYAVNTNQLLCEYTMHACSKLFLLERATGKVVREILLPTLGTVGGLWADIDSSEMFFSFSSFLYPGVVSRHDLSGSSENSEVVRSIVVKGVDTDDFVTEQVFYDSTDGAKIPMFVVHHKELKRDGTNPTLLYGYGGFSIPMSPHFSVSRVIWMQYFRGVYAVGNWRGGTEYGEEWHEAAIREQKQHTFDDVKAGAQWLFDNKFTSPDRMGIMGGSNGGMVVSATANQSPELFSCVVAQVPVADLLQFHKWTIGYAWTSDWGCADEPDDYDFLRKISPLHNIPSPAKLREEHGDASYPALLVTTADHDDRVVPQHSFKFVAEIQHQLGALSNSRGRPLVVRIDVKAGHGAGKPVSKQLEEAAETWGFVARFTGAKWQ